MPSRISVAAALAAILMLSGLADARADEPGFRRAPAYRGGAVYRREFERPYWWYLGYRPYREGMPWGVGPRYPATRFDVSCWAWRPSLLGGWRKDWVCGLW